MGLRATGLPVGQVTVVRLGQAESRTPNRAIDTDYHVAFTRNGSTGAIKGYLDGVEFTSGTTDTKNWTLDYIGGRDATTVDLNGHVDDFRVNDGRILTHAETAYLANNPYAASKKSVYANYNLSANTNATLSFSRDVATRDNRGVDRAVNKRRFARDLAVASLVDWSDSGVTVGSAGTPEVLGSGWDHDGVTPVAVFDDASAGLVRIFSGATPAEARTLPRTDIMNGTVSGKKYFVQSACIFHGLIVFLCQRTEENAPDEIVGTSLIYTTDMGATLTRVPQQGGGDDVPANVAAAGADVDIPRGRQWAMQNPFPVNGIDDKLQVWFPWTDYLSRGSPEPQGGQAGIFKATRPNIGGTWTVQNNRLLDEEWTTATAIHWHTAAVTTGGVLVHTGDNNTQNRLLFLAVDLDNYTTAIVINTVVYGGLDTGGVDQLIAPQPVAAAPAPVLGEHLASSDVTRETVLRFGALTLATDAVVIKELAGRYSRELTGVANGGHASLNLHWQSGVGWVAGGWDGDTEPEKLYDAWVSKDGHNFAEVRLAVSSNVEPMWWYGERLMQIHSDRNIYLAPRPTIDVVAPLTINRGGTNLNTVNLPAQGTSPVNNNEVTVLTYDGDDFLDGASPIVPQPTNQPPFVNGAAMILMEALAGTTDRYFGDRYVQDSGETADWSVDHIIHGWICNLSDVQGAALNTQVGGLVGADYTTEQVHITQGTRYWMSWHNFGEPTNDTALRAELRLRCPFSVGLHAPGAMLLLAVTGFQAGLVPSYSLAQDATGSDELEEFSGFTCKSEWTAAITLAWPEDATLVSSGTYMLATLRQDDTNYVEISYTPTSTTAGKIEAKWVASGSTLDTLLVAVDFYTNQVADIVVSQSGTSIDLFARNAGIDPLTDTGAPTEFVQPTSLRWGSNVDQTTIDMVCPILARIVTDEAWNQTTAEAWMGDPMSMKAGSEDIIRLGPKLRTKLNTHFPAFSHPSAW